jgi:ferrous iron transport protein B
VTPAIVIVGNPNTGKSSLFNGLTGARQHVGNYPGITVERKEGTLRLDGSTARLLDLPGTYSLAAASRDERIVTEVLAGRRADVVLPQAVICIVDATNLRRNLFLVSQVAETGLPLVIALNMIDEANRRDIRIDVDLLARRLGVPVIPTVAPRGTGLGELRKAVAEILRAPAPFPAVPWPDAVVEARRMLGKKARAETGREWNQAELNRLIFDAEAPKDLPEGLAEARAEALRNIEASGLNPMDAEALLRYRHLETLLEGVSTQPDPRITARAYAVDRVLTHRILGLLVFSALLFLVFASIYWLAQPMMDGIEWVFGAAADHAGATLEGRPMLRSLVADGIISGVGSVVIFLPQILILFLFIAILEDTGYMSRAAFLMDKVFSWTGLNGKSFVPMLSSFACAVPGIMATRTIEDPKARLSTILVAPLMSCSARLPIYILIIGAFIEPWAGPLWAGAALFAMHLLGLVVAIPAAWLINRLLLNQTTLPFLLEMPPYRAPQPLSVGMRVYRSGREFIIRAGTIIFSFSIVIWALTYFPRPEGVREEVARTEAAARGITLEEAQALLETDLAGKLDAAYLEQSWIGRFGRLIQPAFEPAGFDWRITVGIVSALPARELFVSTLGIAYAVGEQDEESPALRERMRATVRPDGSLVFTPAVALAIMVFFAFCMQCASTLVVISREAGWRWALFTFGYMTALAWLAAVATFQAVSAIMGV